MASKPSDRFYRKVTLTEFSDATGYARRILLGDGYELVVLQADAKKVHDAFEGNVFPYHQVGGNIAMANIKRSWFRYADSSNYNIEVHNKQSISKFQVVVSKVSDVPLSEMHIPYLRVAFANGHVFKVFVYEFKGRYVCEKAASLLGKKLEDVDWSDVDADMMLDDVKDKMTPAELLDWIAGGGINWDDLEERAIRIEYEPPPYFDMFGEATLSVEG